ncbi:hypothetical protein CC86DRAFT_409780 [Ophiobolus disseminans]|uniref:Uncharacterized protein n=1 Tax=Ophiobolus disseminans TaxID=1469910 RepID=A0A6A6ZQW6_9PLEO|nr:hypothetical protein CC86DRAFT_409780 [Ophiobolus disseminans]
MLTFFTILFYLFTNLATAKGGDKNAYDVETWKYHGYALVEAWVGRDAINVGDLTGAQLYNTMFKALAGRCKQNKANRCDFSANWQWTETRYVKNVNRGELASGYFAHTMEASWSSEEMRLLLFHAVAGMMGSLTFGSTNCYFVPNHSQKFCNTGDHFRLNFPDHDGHANHLWIKLWAEGTNGQFKCCPTRPAMNNALEGWKDEFNSALGADINKWHKGIKCTIGGMMSCEECGSKCDSCGSKC